MAEVSKKELDALRQRHHMLNAIASEVVDWCDNEECTTREAVMLMKAELFDMKARELRNRVELGRKDATG